MISWNGSKFYYLQRLSINLVKNTDNMYISFYISENRLDELKYFIRAFTPTVRFKHNPLKEGNRWFIALTMEVEDGNKLNELFNKWHDEDNSPKRPNKSIWKRMISVFN